MKVVKLLGTLPERLSGPGTPPPSDVCECLAPANNEKFVAAASFPSHPLQLSHPSISRSPHLRLPISVFSGEYALHRLVMMSLLLCTSRMLQTTISLVLLYTLRGS